MTAIELRDHCLSLPGSSFDFPFDTETIVFRVGGRMFALSGIDADPVSVTLKCDPILARDLRAAYDAVTPGYHMNKEHWNTIRAGADLPDDKLRWLIDHSHELVAAGLPRSQRTAGGASSAARASHGSPQLPRP